jgi:hypothetical protein
MVSQKRAAIFSNGAGAPTRCAGLLTGREKPRPHLGSSRLSDGATGRTHHRQDSRMPDPENACPMVFYTANAGYAGPDHIKYEVKSENGEVTTYDVTMTVRAPEPAQSPPAENSQAGTIRGSRAEHSRLNRKSTPTTRLLRINGHFRSCSLPHRLRGLTSESI